MRRFVLTTLLLTCPALAQADITVQFTDGAPKDRFVIANSGCPIDRATVTLDLSTAPTGLIFDVTAAGAGVEVFQPVEVVAGQASVAQVTDGDQILGLGIRGLAADGSVEISADIDDTLDNGASGQIIVRGSEIAGATVIVAMDEMEYSGAFDSNGKVQIATPACLS